MSVAKINPLGYLWSWTANGVHPTSGHNFDLTARAWLSFLSFINEARLNVGNPAISFDTYDILQGNRFKAGHYMDAYNAISSATGHATLPDITTYPVAQNRTIYGQQHFAKIQDAINGTAQYHEDET